MDTEPVVDTEPVEVLVTKGKVPAGAVVTEELLEVSIPAPVSCSGVGLLDAPDIELAMIPSSVLPPSEVGI